MSSNLPFLFRNRLVCLIKLWNDDGRSGRVSRTQSVGVGSSYSTCGQVTSLPLSFVVPPSPSGFSSTPSSTTVLPTPYPGGVRVYGEDPPASSLVPDSEVQEGSSGVKEKVRRRRVVSSKICRERRREWYVEKRQLSFHSKLSRSGILSLCL